MLRHVFFVLRCSKMRSISRSIDFLKVSELLKNPMRIFLNSKDFLLLTHFYLYSITGNRRANMPHILAWLRNVTTTNTKEPFFEFHPLLSPPKGNTRNNFCIRGLNLGGKLTY